MLTPSSPIATLAWKGNLGIQLTVFLKTTRILEHCYHRLQTMSIDWNDPQQKEGNKKGRVQLN